MAKYIDVYKAEKVLVRQTWLNNIDLITAVGALKLLVPAADVAEVNRCKTCFHYKPREYGYNCTVLDWDVNEDDFCSRWEAKDE